METGTFDHNGIVFHYDRIGEGRKHVVLQHGFSDFAPCWGNMPLDLSNGGYQVVMMDARGHGRSGKPASGYNLDTMTKDMMAFTQYLKLDRPVVIGHSMGASMAARAASSNPQLLRAVVLIDPVFRDIPPEEMEQAITQRTSEINDLKNFSHKEILEITRQKHPSWPEIYIESGAMGKIFMSMHILNIFNTIDKGWREDLDKAKCPILLITADEKMGAIVSKDTSNWIRENYSNVKILHVPNVGHNTHRENYPQVFEGINDFLSHQF